MFTGLQNTSKLMLGKLKKCKFTYEGNEQLCTWMFFSRSSDDQYGQENFIQQEKSHSL